MTDFETHPVGTAARIAELEAAITRANADTSAAYEVAAQVIYADNYDDPESAGDAIRAIATPDQTAALDKLIAEAEARVWKEAEKLVRPTRGKSGNGIVVAALHRVADALLEASKKGGA